MAEEQVEPTKVFGRFRKVAVAVVGAAFLSVYNHTAGDGNFVYDAVVWATTFGVFEVPNVPSWEQVQQVVKASGQPHNDNEF
jgi:hypothetical protein